MPSHVAIRLRDLGSFGVCLMAGGLALGDFPRVPGLSLVDLGVASLGHLAGHVIRGGFGTPLPPAVGGLVLPVVVPLYLAVRFLGDDRQRHLGALCLAWAATVLTASAVALTSAARPGPAGGGAPADWAVVLGPRGIHELGRAAGVASALRGSALLLFVAAALVCAVPLIAELVRAAGPRPPAGAWDGPNRRRI